MRFDLNFFGNTKAVAQELLGLFCVLQNIILAIGLESDDHSFVRDLIARTGQNGSRGRESADEYLRQIAEIHIGQFRGRIPHEKFQLLQSVLLFYGLTERLKLLFCKIVLRLCVQTDGSCFPVKFCVDDGKALQRLRQILRQRKARKQRGEIYFIHGLVPV